MDEFQIGESSYKRLLSPVILKDGTVVRYAKIKRLFGPDLAQVSKMLEGVDKSASDMHKFYLFIAFIVQAGISGFYTEPDILAGAQTAFIRGKLDTATAFDLAVFIAVLTKGSAFITASFKCSGPQCGKYAIFDLDRRHDRADAEFYRDFQVDFLQAYCPTYNEDGVPYYDFQPRIPYTIISAKGYKEYEISSIRTNFPPLADIAAMAKEDGAAVGQMRALYKNIVSINGKPAQETVEILRQFTAEQFFRLAPDEYQEYVNGMDTFSFQARFTYECPHCAFLNPDRGLDLSNFFAFLKKSM